MDDVDAKLLELLHGDANDILGELSVCSGVGLSSGLILGCR
jgi:hypothetical protein